VDTPNRFVRTLAVEDRPADGLEGTADRCQKTADREVGVAWVVDDEPLVRAFVSTLLRNRGWSVIERPMARARWPWFSEALGLLVTDYRQCRPSRA